MIAEKMIMPTVCTRSFPIGYMYMFIVFIDKCVNQRIPLAIKPSNESRVDAAMAMDPLFTVAYI